MPAVCMARSQRQPSAAASDVLQPAASPADSEANPSGSQIDSLASVELNDLLCNPEDFVLPPGELSVVDRQSDESPEDVFRCPGCTRPACQVWPRAALGGAAARHRADVAPCGQGLWVE